jgi:PST family polysaccharide transporter
MRPPSIPTKNRTIKPWDETLKGDYGIRHPYRASNSAPHGAPDSSGMPMPSDHEGSGRPVLHRNKAQAKGDKHLVVQSDTTPDSRLRELAVCVTSWRNRMHIDEAKRRYRTGPTILLARRGFALVINFVSTITIARMVGPAAYGLANMSAVLLAFGLIFREFGLTSALLRKGSITQEEMSFIFWFNCAMTILLAIVIALIAPLAADFYHEPSVTKVIIYSLIGFIAGGIFSQHRSLLGRELRFGELAIVDAASLFAGFSVSITWAYFSHDVWAIVAGNVVQATCGSLVCVFVSRWRPDRPRRTENMRSLLAFGANTSVFSLSVFLSNNAAPIIIGHFLGSAPLGQFNRALALFSLPTNNLIQPITQATLPFLARLRIEPEEYRKAYIGMVRKLCTFLIPISVIFTCSGIPLTRALLGDGWDTAGFVLTALAPALCAVGLGYSISDLFITQDRSSELRTLGLVEMVIRVGSVVIGVWYGIVGAAIGFSLATLLAVALRLIVVGKSGPVTIKDQIIAAVPGAIIALGSGIGCALVLVLHNGAVRDGEVASIAYAAIIVTAGSIGGLAVGLINAPSRSAIRELGQLFGLNRFLGRFR